MDVKKYNYKKCVPLKKPLLKDVIHDITKNVCFGISKKPLVKNVIHDISKMCAFEKTISKKCNS